MGNVRAEIDVLDDVREFGEVVGLDGQDPPAAAEMIGQAAAGDLIQRRHRPGMLGVLRPPGEELLEDLAEDLPAVVPAGLAGQEPQHFVHVRFVEGGERRLVDLRDAGDLPAGLGRLPTEPRS
ncbi:hypothetical protein [Streptomyces sp. NPDC057580]|uniref:hypothetical protein n=1 Tax=Streptomyces sp. NPDC057580 TaxID=3346173 RepID=UPI0036AC2915